MEFFNSSVVSVSKNGTIYAKKDRKCSFNGNIGRFAIGMCSFGCYPGKKTYGSESYSDCKDLYIQPAKAYAGKILRLQFSGVEIYHKNGVNFGMAYYAPVAADMGKWCVQHKKLVSGGMSRANIQNMKLNPGGCDV